MGTFRAEDDYDRYRFLEDAPEDILNLIRDHGREIGNEFLWYLTDTIEVDRSDLGGFISRHTTSEWHITAVDMNGNPVGEFYAPGDWHFAAFAHDFWAYADEFDLEYEREDVDY